MFKNGDDVKLLSNTTKWKGWGFDKSKVVRVGVSLILIQSLSGHTMYVKPHEIEMI
jgi:hypothetical protein